MSGANADKFSVVHPQSGAHLFPRAVPAGETYQITLRYTPDTDPQSGTPFFHEATATLAVLPGQEAESFALALQGGTVVLSNVYEWQILQD